MANATPGPWAYSWESADRAWAIVTDSAGSIVANVNTESGPDFASAPATRKMPAEANARLIASAPAMLTALRELQAWATDAFGPEGATVPPCHPIAKARAAVLAAIGEEVRP